jgi:hypothetical protein
MMVGDTTTGQRTQARNPEVAPATQLPGPAKDPSAAPAATQCSKPIQNRGSFAPLPRQGGQECPTVQPYLTNCNLLVVSMMQYTGQCPREGNNARFGLFCAFLWPVPREGAPVGGLTAAICLSVLIPDAVFLKSLQATRWQRLALRLGKADAEPQESGRLPDSLLLCKSSVFSCVKAPELPQLPGSPPYSWF